MQYGLKLDQNAGLQVVCTREGVAFEQLPELVFEMDDLCEFEQHRAARLLKGVKRRPCTTVTNLSHLIKEPMMSFASAPEDVVQYKMEIYQLPDKGAEIVMEYPAASGPMPWLSLMFDQQGGDDLNERTESTAMPSDRFTPNREGAVPSSWDSDCERLIFALSEQEMLSLVSLCRVVSRG